MDDLLDLSWSDSKTAAPKPAARSTQPAFDFLAKPLAGPNYFPTSSSKPPTRGSTPKTAPLPQQARLPDATYRSTTPNPPSASTSNTTSNGDAFSSLFSLAGGANTSNTGSSMSLADRQKQSERERAEKADKERAQYQAEGSFWDNLGSSSKASPSSTPASTHHPFGGFDDLLAPQPVRPSTLRQSHTPSPAPPPAAIPTPRLDPWDDDDTFLAAPPKPTSTASPQPQSDPFNFDALGDDLAGLRTEQSDKHAPSSGMRTPLSDFDFEESNGDNDDDDDPHDRSSKPAPGAKKSQIGLAHATAPTPPPHIIGQLVEMGFSPTQARAALAKTASGVDVQAALESLLSAQAGSSRAPDDFEDEDQVMRERARRQEAEAERRRRRRAGPSRESVTARGRDDPTARPLGDSEYGEQADKFIAQASEMGQSFLKGATSLWNSSKEKAMRAYEEQRRAMEAGQEGRRKEVRTDGRPRWMMDADETPAHESSSAFKDDEDVHATRPAEPRRQRPHPGLVDSDLLAGDAPKSYQPAHRRKPATTARPAQAPSRQATPVRQPTPPPPRALVNANPSQIQSSAAKKTAGNEHFKLGRFSEAEAAYTSAISSLPEGHLLLIPLHNNRAATRLKLGQSAGAVEDCSIVINLVGPTYHPSKEAPLPADLAAEVRLGESLVKAVSKRAQAYEMSEKWKLALEDWERALGFDASLGGGSRATASDGVRRAKKMLEGGSTNGSNAPPRPVKPAQPAFTPKPVNIATSQAVSDLRKANQAAEAEDNQRAELRGSVDAKVLAWKSGKETNLRALIASLSTVLWPDILAGGLVVGMHELITDKQVKIKYMKVIARLHPDKLNTMSTTVEQKMMANSVFHELNTAWSKLNSSA